MPVALGVGGRVAVVELDRPEASNALDLALVAEAAAALKDLRTRDDFDVVVLLGRGSAFCVGGDVRAMASSRDRPGFLRELADAAHAVVRGLMALDAPLVVGVQGSAAGAGLALTLAADLVVAGESARFVTAYTAIGLTPDCGTSWLLPRIVGTRRATDLLFSNRPIGATEAMQCGLVTRVCADDEVEEATLCLARQLADGPIDAIRETRRLIRSGGARSLDEHLDAEAAAIVRAGGGPEATALIDAFDRRGTTRKQS